MGKKTTAYIKESKALMATMDTQLGLYNAARTNMDTCNAAADPITNRMDARQAEIEADFGSPREHSPEINEALMADPELARLQTRFDAIMRNRAAYAGNRSTAADAFNVAGRSLRTKTNTFKLYCQGKLRKGEKFSSFTNASAAIDEAESVLDTFNL
jgi:hypothetical protein